MRFKLLFLLLFTACSYAQKNNYVLLYSGEQVFGQNVTLRSKVFQKNKVLVDDEVFNASDIKFYKATNGFFANVKDINSFTTSSFAERTLEGKINLFAREVINTSFGGAGIGGVNGFNTMPMMTTTVSNIYYYNTEEFGPLKKSNYENLIVDLQDNSESMAFLEKYKSAKKTSTLMYLLGGIMVAAGSVKLINETSGDNSENAEGSFASFGLLIGGGLTIGITSLLSRDRHHHIEDAIRAYNRTYNAE